MTPKRDRVTGKFISAKRNKNATERGTKGRGPQYKGTKKGSPKLDGSKNTGRGTTGGTGAKKEKTSKN